MVQIILDLEKCMGCGSCIEICPANIYLMNPKTNKPRIDNPDNCFGCKACEILCDINAISVNILIEI